MELSSCGVSLVGSTGLKILFVIVLVVLAALIGYWAATRS
jgi:hypothetical protein